MIFSLRLLSAWFLVVIPNSAFAARACQPLLVRIGLLEDRSRDFVIPPEYETHLRTIAERRTGSSEDQRRSLVHMYQAARLAGFSDQDRTAVYGYASKFTSPSYYGLARDPRLGALLARPDMAESPLQILPAIQDFEARLLNLEFRRWFADSRALAATDLADLFRAAALRAEGTVLKALPESFLHAEIARIEALKKMAYRDRRFATGLLRAAMRSPARYAAVQSGWFSLGRKLDFPIESDDTRALVDQHRVAVVRLIQDWRAFDAVIARALASPDVGRALALASARPIPPEIVDAKAWARAQRRAALEKEWRTLNRWTDDERRERAFVVDRLELAPRLRARLRVAILKSNLDFESYIKLRANKHRLNGEWVTR